MKILVTGDRNWTDVKIVIHTLERFSSGTILVHGACRGADVTCSAVGEALGFEIRPYPADWEKYQRAAGVVRNQQMLDEENVSDEPIDVCLAFHNDIANSRGTRDMMKRAEKAKIKVILIVSTSHMPP